MLHKEQHYGDRINWLRAAVLGANDGIISTASLIMGVAAAKASHESILIAGVAGMVAGAMSMAAGEYVSVSSQSDSELADSAREKLELETDSDFELEELTNIYVERGLDKSLAHQVATQLTSHDALGAHLRDELGISELTRARPIQAALASAASFVVGAALPLLASFFAPIELLAVVVSILSLIFLGVLGSLSAIIGGAPIVRASARILIWGTLAMAATAAVGKLFGVVV